MKLNLKLASSILLCLATSATLALTPIKEKPSELGKGGNNGIGIRIGGPFGVTFKHFISSNTALELIIGGGHPGFGFTGLYEIHKPLTGASNFYWLYGFGAHIGVYNRHYYYGYSYKGEGYYADSGASIGVDGILGLEYRAREIPFTFGIDIKPYFDLIPVDPGLDAGFSIRYNF